jgi:uncharacterized membrane protein YoaK (UPF0700 family)
MTREEIHHGRSLGLAVALGAAMGAAIGAATGHMGVWVAAGIGSYLAISVLAARWERNAEREGRR